jgi:hypothetical protein
MPFQSNTPDLTTQPSINLFAPKAISGDLIYLIDYFKLHFMNDIVYNTKQYFTQSYAHSA